jgi:hypothetical protein
MGKMESRLDRILSISFTCVRHPFVCCGAAVLSCIPRIAHFTDFECPTMPIPSSWQHLSNFK